MGLEGFCFCVCRGDKGIHASKAVSKYQLRFMMIIYIMGIYIIEVTLLYYEIPLKVATLQGHQRTS